MSVLDVTQTAANLSAHPEEYVMEYQVESERGFHVLGSSVFSSNAFMPMDPSHFTSTQGEPLGAKLTDFEVPDDSWVWAWSRWYVDMSADVDDQGWCYSWRFHSRHWSSRHRLMRSFVRQRVWKRPRVKRSLIMHSWAPGADRHPTSHPANDDANNDDSDETADVEKRRSAAVERRAKDMVAHVRGLRNDRERINEIVKYISEHPDDITLLVDIRERLLATLNFAVSKRTLITKLSESSNQNCQLFILAPSNNWRDQVLRHGAPDWETQESDDKEKEEEINMLAPN